MAVKMESFCAEQFTAFLGRLEKLKSIPRHCVTSDGVVENVAGHSWRTAMMAYLMKDELGEIDIDKVIRMCLVHDWGEAITGDVPTFEKTKEQEDIEKGALEELLKELPEPLGRELTALFAEMEAQETTEAKVYKALDKLEAVIQHNESDIATWLPLEYELQQTYAAESVKGVPFLEALQDVVVKKTREKIAAQNEDPAIPSETGDGDSFTKTQAGQNLTLREKKRQEKKQARAERKTRRDTWRREQRKQIGLSLRLIEFVMLAVFVILAIDQVGVYGFFFVWFFIALMAASIALLLAGVWRITRKKRSGVLIIAAVTGILLCFAWFLYLVSGYGLGLGPFPQ